MGVAESLFIIGLVIIVGFFAQYMFRKTKIPDALILISFGAILSLFGLTSGFDKSSDTIIFLITLSLIYVVFYGALPIRLRAMFSTMKFSLLYSILNVLIITSVLGLISYLIGFDPILAVCLGAMFCVLDGSIINSLLEIIKIDKKAEAQIQTESAITDIFVIVGILALVNFSKVGIDSVISTLASYLLLSLVIGVIAAVIWAFTLKIVGNYGSVSIATMAILIMIYAFSEYVKSNGIMAVFFFSIVLSNAPIWSQIMYKKQKEDIMMLDSQSKDFFKDIAFFIRIFLFTYLGILVDFTNTSYLFIGFAFFIIAYILRSFVFRFIINRDIKKKDNSFMENMCAKGLTPIALLGIVSANAQFTNIIVGGIFSSVLITSIFIFMIDKDKFSNLFLVFHSFKNKFVKHEIVRNGFLKK